MGMALIFASHLHEVITAWGGGEGYTDARIEMRDHGGRQGCQANPVSHSMPRAVATPVYSGSSGRCHAREKSLDGTSTGDRTKTDTCRRGAYPKALE